MREKQIIILMISNEERWHYHVVKQLSALLREMMSKYNCKFHCLNFFHLFRIKKT